MLVSAKKMLITLIMLVIKHSVAKTRIMLMLVFIIKLIFMLNMLNLITASNSPFLPPTVVQSI